MSKDISDFLSNFKAVASVSSAILGVAKELKSLLSSDADQQAIMARVEDLEKQAQLSLANIKLLEDDRDKLVETLDQISSLVESVKESISARNSES